LRAGVSAYVVDSLDPKRIGTIIDVAVAQFEDVQRLRGELADANQKLSERRLDERAKGLLMKSRSYASPNSRSKSSRRRPSWCMSPHGAPQQCAGILEISLQIRTSCMA